MAARTHPAAVRGIAYLETLLAPVTWDGPNAPDLGLFRLLRSAAGEEMVLRDNVFVERVLPAGTLRHLTDREMDDCRRPCSQPQETTVPGLHFLPEDSPGLIGRGIAGWLRNLP